MLIAGQLSLMHGNLIYRTEWFTRRVRGQNKNFRYVHLFKCVILLCSTV